MQSLAAKLDDRRLSPITHMIKGGDLTFSSDLHTGAMAFSLTSLAPSLPHHKQTHTAMIKNNKKEGAGIGPVGICFSNVALAAEIDVFDRHRKMN